MNDEKHDDWRVVVVGTDNAKCRACGEPVRRGDRAWYLVGQGVQHLECSSKQDGVEEARP